MRERFMPRLLMLSELEPLYSESGGGGAKDPLPNRTLAWPLTTLNPSSVQNVVKNSSSGSPCTMHTQATATINVQASTLMDWHTSVRCAGQVCGTRAGNRYCATNISHLPGILEANEHGK